VFCPQCGLERVSTETIYCSRCGFLLTGATELLRTGGMIPQAAAPASSAGSARNRGLKQGLFIFLLSFLIVPIIAIISIALQVQEPFFVAIAAVLLFMGGLLRMAYAVLFESSSGASVSNDPAVRAFTGQRTDQNALPPQREMPASAYAPPGTGNWRDTNDLQPTSVTESTTKLLDEEEAWPSETKRDK
jgi:hypothetical protein